MATPSYAHLPLCVDLDGTLIRSDTFFEYSLTILRRRPFLLFFFPWRLLASRARFKEWLSLQVDLSPAHLSYNNELLQYIKLQHRTGRRLILATAANQKVARAIAQYLGIFSEVYASTSGLNLKGAAKEKLLVEKFGRFGFVYAGDSPSDWKVWRSAAAAIPVNVSLRHFQRLDKSFILEKTFRRPPLTLNSLSALLRSRHWVKNLLVFVPLAASHQLGNIPLLWAVFLSFIALNFTASAFYIFNDMLDLPSDRRHPVKMHRPLASHAISLPAAALISLFLLVAAFATAFIQFAIVPWILVYSLLALAYSLVFKKYYYFSILILSAFYLVRLYTGAAAAGIAISGWLLSTMACILLSLSFAKRLIDRRQQNTAPGRHNRPLLPLIFIGLFFAAAAIPILALYVASSESRLLYSRPAVLWTLLPLTALGLARIWYFALSNRVYDDPLLLAWRDFPSQLTLFAFVTILLLAA